MYVIFFNYSINVYILHLMSTKIYSSSLMATLTVIVVAVLRLRTRESKLPTRRHGNKFIPVMYSDIFTYVNLCKFQAPVNYVRVENRNLSLKLCTRTYAISWIIKSDLFNVMLSISLWIIICDSFHIWHFQRNNHERTLRYCVCTLWDVAHMKPCTVVTENCGINKTRLEN